MALSETYTAYLADGSDSAVAERLMAGLKAAGYSLEAYLLKQHINGPNRSVRVEVEGPWRSGIAQLGLAPPQPRDPGELWFDPFEVMPMVLLPAEAGNGTHVRGSAFRSWLATRPVARWQFAAFLALAPTSPRRTQLSPPIRLLDKARLLRSPETDPVTDVTLPEAAMYATWFGKSLAGVTDWRIAARFLSAEKLQALRGPCREELAGEFAEGVGAVVRPDSWGLDYDDAYDSGSHPDLFIGEFQVRPSACFRTRVLAQLGLITTPGLSEASLADVLLDRILPRR